MQAVSGEVWKASLQAEQRGMRDKVSNVVQAAFSALSLQCSLAPQREPREAAAVAELMTPVLLEKVLLALSLHDRAHAWQAPRLAGPSPYPQLLQHCPCARPAVQAGQERAAQGHQGLPE